MLSNVIHIVFLSDTRPYAEKWQVPRDGGGRDEGAQTHPRQSEYAEATCEIAQDIDHCIP